MSEVILSLEKGERVDLTKTNPTLVIAYVGLGWDVNKGIGQPGVGCVIKHVYSNFNENI